MTRVSSACRGRRRSRCRSSRRLGSDTGGEQVVLAGHLMAAPDFALLAGRTLPPVEPFGLLAAMPAEAERWRAHVVEVETGRPPGAAAGTPFRRLIAALMSLLEGQLHVPNHRPTQPRSRRRVPACEP
jgi:hypothetical protein